ncbi:MAG TPA: hypothetical protein DDW52_07195 [Planctomycetaceae bacterium]|nr:hypothetical protein [Planctomycetaceae bacterium]
MLRVMQPNPQLTRQKLWAARQTMPQRLARPSKLRKISLNRLEAAIAKQLSSGENINDEMFALAGLTRLEYVFFYPETGDIVIAGPAEGFAEDAVGRIVGVETGKPCLRLDDLVVALRAFAPQAKATNVISVSIDPTQEGLARMQQAIRQLAANFRGPQDTPVVLQTLKQSLGMNEVTIKGISPATHFAHVLTEADYRMKLIGIGRQAPPVRNLISYASQIGSGSTNALMRWYFVPNYEAIAANDDMTAMKLTGKGLKLIDENEFVTSDGQRKKSTRPNPASKRYTTSFTKHFNAVAAVDPVYAELRNLVDLTIAAAFIQKQDFYTEAGWDLGTLGSESALPVQTLPEPRQVETAVNAILKGNRLITPIGGGVAIQPRKALEEENVARDAGLGNAKASVSLSELADGQWWWD